MKSYRYLLLTLLMAVSPAVHSSDLDSVTESIDQIIYEGLPEGTDIALMVYDLTNDTTLYAYREKIMCRPASVQKVITSVTALSSLGADYKFRTTLRTQGSISKDSVLNGNLYLVGGLDPALTEHELRSMVASLKKAGVKRISGTLYADVSAMDSTYWATGWCWDDAPASFQPYISPLMVHQGFVGIEVKPTSKGQAPVVNIYPSNSYIKVVNKARTQDNTLGPLTITRDWMHNDNTIIVEGNCKRRQSTDLSVVGSADFTFALLRQYLDEAGISYGKYDWATCPVIARDLAEVTHDLPSIVKEALKESNNLFAEAMFLQTGRLQQPKEVSFKVAAKYLQNFVNRKFGMFSASYNIVDGCGLSQYDLCSPQFMVDMLSLIYKDNELFPILYKSMPISGVDGTLKTRMNDKTTINKVHAKTGSLTGTCTLAGYIRTADGRDLAFCIMNEGAVKMAPSRKVQDQICKVLCELGL
ncbi:MAG: D-alanyl-D-alanine carboxypeptidase/D-alanyl-D-alanine-endopeptidase [Bacteroidaceae bacterium]|jgi:D-alanyl-D-alanine carboxypeptidase/D-alanyl-D-alanine-endopeptidase (penicillin-binding protein 4)|nr:D-alanyl-D-alanine carboxypeptidase/D-alanyl-D-alanine-endopeptidase [Bacteroidaceae bacterium]